MNLRIRLLVTVLVCGCTAYAGFDYVQVPLRHASAGSPKSVRMLRDNDRLLAPLTTVAELFAFRWRWEPVDRRLVCWSGRDTVELVQEAPFARVNGRIVLLTEGPIRAGGDLFLPLPVAAGVFNPFSQRVLRWANEGTALEFCESPFTITAVTCTYDESLTRVAVMLAESTAVTTSYRYPVFEVNIIGARIDPAEGGCACGVVESLAVAQVGNDARVRIRTKQPVDTPVVRTWGGGRRVTVEIRRAARGKAIPDSVLFGKGFSDTIGVVVIDPGHGGEDPGAIGPGGLREKDVTLAVALELRDLLKKKSDLKVYMTRDSDTFVPLGERTRFANAKGADIFVSIHANAVSGNDSRRKTVRGYKMYFLSQAKNEEDRLVAMQENAVVELERSFGGSTPDYLQSVLTDMVNNEYLRESQDLSILLAESFDRSVARLRRLHTGVGQANFYVLNGAFMPAVLVEIAFISHPEEERLLGDRGFQKEVAKAIFEAIMEFKKKYGGGR